MTFMVKIVRAPVEVAFEAGSVGEALEILQEDGEKLAELFGVLPVTAADVATVAAMAGGEQGTPAKRRGRPSTKNQPDPATASAPPPAPVPGAAPPAMPAPVPGGPSPADQVAASAQNGLQVPPFLARQEAAPPPPAAAAAPPPPPMPAAPPTVPAAPPPAGVLAPKVITELKRRAQGQPDGGQSLADWLAQAGLVVAGAKFDEALACLPFLSDDKLAPVASALEVK